MSPDFALALHTTTDYLEIALGDLPGVDDSQANSGSYLTAVQARSWVLGREMSLKLHDCLQEFMADRDWQNCQFIAIAQGIGSYAGTRMGVVVARTLAQQLAIPLYGFDCETIREYAQNKALENQVEALLHLAVAKNLARSSKALESKSDWSSVLPLYAESV
jgi:tRNA A37 threonylcarbamoyladenosine modification protein TsaB